MKKDWSYYSKKAKNCLYEAQSNLKTSVYLLAIEKGFTEEQSRKFNACFASGRETVVNYDHCGEMADIDLQVMASMTKEKIIEELSECGAIFN